MESERKIFVHEDRPLNAGAANIYLNTTKSKSAKVNSPDGTVIHLNTDKQADLGVHINTTLSIASSKKIKLFFVLNFLLSLVVLVICFSAACYYWHELTALRRQVDLIKDHCIVQNMNLNQDKIIQSPLVRPRPSEDRESREARSKFGSGNNAKQYYVEDLGDDVLLIDTKKKNYSDDKTHTDTKIATVQKELLVAQFNGGIREYRIKEPSVIGPWVRDLTVSSKNSEDQIELNKDYVTIKESGLYLVYAQVVYLTQAPNCYFIWASHTGQEPRLLSACATGDDSSGRPIDKSHISCSVQTVARLHKGDVVNIAQREPNRTLLLRPGYSYFGFVKLSS